MRLTVHWLARSAQRLCKPARPTIACPADRAAIFRPRCASRSGRSAFGLFGPVVPSFWPESAG